MNAIAQILDKKEMITLPTGATIYELKNGGIEYLCGGERISIGIHGSVSNGAGDGAGGGAWTNQVNNFFMRATEEGKYRLKFRAGAFAGKGKFAVENVKLTFDYGKGGQTANLDTRVGDHRCAARQPPGLRDRGLPASQAGNQRQQQGTPVHGTECRPLGRRGSGNDGAKRPHPRCARNIQSRLGSRMSTTGLRQKSKGSTYRLRRSTNS